MRVSVLLIALAAGCSTIPPERARAEADLAALQAFGSLVQATPERIDEYRKRLAAYERSAQAYDAWLACNGQEPEFGWPDHCGRKSNNRPKKLLSDEERLDRVEVTGARLAAPDVITNNQEAAVDEGGIFKKHGDFLIALRAGHLYSVAINAAETDILELRDAESLLPPGDDGPWLDELLVVDGTVIVLGFDPGSGTSQIFVFELSAEGRIQPRGRYEFESWDYFSWSNYGARIVGDELVIFTSQSFGEESSFDLPRWRMHGAGDEAWRRMDGPTALYLPATPSHDLNLSGFVRCRIAGLKQGHFDCALAGVVAGKPDVHFVAADAAYFATTDVLELPRGTVPRGVDRYTSVVYRLPLTPGAQPAFAKVPGHITSPLQLAKRGDRLFILSDDHDRPDSISLRLSSVDWRPIPGRLEYPTRFVAEQRSRMMDYAARFAGDRVWIAAERDRDGKPFLLDNLLTLDTNGGVALTSLSHPADRIEIVDDRVVIGGEGENFGWRLSLAQAAASTIRVGSPHLITGFYDGESRTHGFNRGVVGGRTLFAFIGEQEEPYEGDEPRRPGLFFEADGLQLRPAGELDVARFAKRPIGEGYDEYDWYGDSRIAFVGQRVFMLGQWGLLEGRLHGAAVSEFRSVALDPDCCR